MTRTISSLHFLLLGIEIKVANYQELPADMRSQIFRARKEVFIDRKQWDVESYSGGEFEFDQYDNSEAYYLCTMEDNNVTGCVRLRPSKSPTLMTGPFEWLRQHMPIKDYNNINTWEASRFFISPRSAEPTGYGLFNRRTHALFLCMIAFGLIIGISHYEVVVDASMLRILRMNGWPLEVLNSGRASRNDIAYYGLLPCSDAMFTNIYKIHEKQRGALVSSARNGSPAIPS